MTVSLAPSRTRISTFCACCAVPECRKITVARELAPASITTCACAMPPVPTRLTMTGSESSTPAGMRMSGASASCVHAMALARSSGRKNSPRGACPGASRDCSTPSGAWTSTWMTPCGASASSNRGRSRSTGVYRQLTSRPVGSAKSSGSNDRGRSDRVCTGTNAPAPSECAREPGTTWGASCVVVI